MNYFNVLNKALRTAYVANRSYKRQYENNKSSNIRLYNWWTAPNCNWLRDFVLAHNIVPDSQILNFCSVGGARGVCSLVKKEGKMVFYTQENTHDDPLQYADYLLADVKPDLALGFDIFERPEYMRFPLWITYMFGPSATDAEIRTRCQELRYPHIYAREHFASLIARYDWRGTRSSIVSDLLELGFVSCPSMIMHNDDSLVKTYNNDKVEYLKHFIFNICPENTNNIGYVTEKPFEAIAAGCIPIYWGSFNNPEPLVLNKDAMILWNMFGKNEENIKLISNLISSPSLLQEFLQQPRLVNTAEEFVLDTIHELENRLRKLFQ